MSSANLRVFVPLCETTPGSVNPTASLLISRLPATATVSPEDIAAAIGLRSTSAIIRAMASGQISACYIGNRYIVARSEAERWIAASAVNPDESE